MHFLSDITMDNKILIIKKLIFTYRSNSAFYINLDVLNHVTYHKVTSLQMPRFSTYLNSYQADLKN